MQPKEKIAPSRWYRIIPVVFIAYSLAFLDRANYGFGTAGGMNESLHISTNVSSWLASLFFLGYFFFQIPGAHYAANRSAKKLIFWSLILWGSFAAITGVATDVRILIVARFMLGVVEGAVFPAMLLLLSRWFTKAERSRANTLLIFGNPITVLWMSIVSGYLIKSVGWRGMFIWEGVPAIVWAFFWWKLIDDRPRDAKWLKQDEKIALEEALQKEQQGIRPVKNYVAAFKSTTVVLLSLQYFLWSLGFYGFVIWLPSIIKATPGMTIVKIGWLSSVPYLAAVIGMIITSYFSDKTLERKIYVWPSLLIGAAAFYGSYLVGAVNFGLYFTLLTIAGMAMYIPFGPFWASVSEILPTNVLAGAMALINSLGALGSFVGTKAVGYLSGVTKGFGASYLLMAVSLLLSAILSVIAFKISSKTHHKSLVAKVA
jgi:sugar phosphate permease